MYEFHIGSMSYFSNPDIFFSLSKETELKVSSLLKITCLCFFFCSFSRRVEPAA